jgi:hypothetical protein
VRLAKPIHRYDQRRRIAMKRTPQLSRQLNLPLLKIPTTVIPPDKHSELVLALVELLIEAAHAITPYVRNNGGADEPETHR